MLGHLFIASVLPVIKVCLLGGLGTICARTGLLPAESRHTLSKLVYNVFTPAIIFAKLGASLSADHLRHWWPLPLNLVFSIVAGLGLGKLSNHVVQPPEGFEKHTLAAIALGNVGNLPLVLATALVKEAGFHIAGDDEAEQNLAIAYVSMGILVASLVHFTLGYHMLRPPTSSSTSQQDLPPGASSDCEAHKTSADDRNAKTKLLPSNDHQSSSIRSNSSIIVAWNDDDDDATAGGRSASEAAVPSPNSTHVGFANTRTTALQGVEEGTDATMPTSFPAGSKDEQLMHAHQAEQQALHLSIAPPHPGGSFHIEASSRVSSCTGSQHHDNAPALLSHHQHNHRHSSQPSFAQALRNLLNPSQHQKYTRLREASWSQQDATANDADDTIATTPVTTTPAQLQRLSTCVQAAYKHCSPMLTKLYNAPVLSCILSLIVGTTPFLKTAFFGNGGVLRVVGSTIDMVGDCCVPIIVILLGATLEAGPGAVPMPSQVIIAVCLCRLVLLPLAGLATVVGALSLGLFHCPDPMFLLVMLLQNTMPTALNVHAIATIHRSKAQELACLMFWQYMMTVLIVPGWLMLYLYIAHLYF